MGQVGRFGPKVGGHLALLLHSSREPCELSQCSKHDDSTINIVVVIILLLLLLLLLPILLDVVLMSLALVFGTIFLPTSLQHLLGPLSENV